MPIPKFKVGDLVTTETEVYQVNRLINTEADPSYEVLLVAFLRDCEATEWHNQLDPKPVSKSETELRKFDQPKPKYSLGERVKLQDFDCVVRFIQYTQSAYYYSVMSIDQHGPSGMGWKKEESYLSK